MAFEDDLAAAVRAFGVDKIGLVWGMAMADWESPEQRDQFLNAASQYKE